MHTKRCKPVFERVSAYVNGQSVTLVRIELPRSYQEQTSTPMRSLDAPPYSTRQGIRPSAHRMEVTNG